MCLTVSSTKLVCYFTNWSQYRPGTGRFLPGNVDPDLCTHLIYAFSVINHANELVTYEWNDETLYRSFNGLKDRYVAGIQGHVIVTCIEMTEGIETTGGGGTVRRMLLGSAVCNTC